MVIEDTGKKGKPKAVYKLEEMDSLEKGSLKIYKSLICTKNQLNLKALVYTTEAIPKHLKLQCFGNVMNIFVINSR